MEATRSAVGVPVVVDGAFWGVIAVGTREAEPFPADLEDRLADFTELVATAIANSQAHEQLTQLADEQAALRRVATLVAEGATPTVCSTRSDRRWHRCSTPPSAC